MAKWGLGGQYPAASAVCMSVSLYLPLSLSLSLEVSWFEEMSKTRELHMQTSEHIQAEK